MGEVVEYFTTILLTQKMKATDMLANYIINVTAILINFQSKSNQTKYISGLVQYLTNGLTDTIKIEKTLEMLTKLAGHGRCGTIRTTENGLILEYLVGCCLSWNDTSSDSDIIYLSLRLLTMLYESPHCIKEHATLKTELFVQFLTHSVGVERYSRECARILKFLILNDPKHKVLRQSKYQAAKSMPDLEALGMALAG